MNRYERVLAGGGESSNPTGLAMAEASLRTRLRVPAGDGHRSALWEVGASVGGPVLTAYVLWVLRKAEDLGLDRLYFIARDGQVLHRLASWVQDGVGRRIELRYLYGSRLVWGAGSAAHPLLPAYLRQEELVDGARCGLVDIGWRGRAVNALGDALEASAAPAPCVFYFGRLGSPNTQVGSVLPIHPYLFDHVAGTGSVELMPDVVTPGVFETLSAGEEGTVSSYAQQGELVVPVLSGENTGPLRWGLRGYHSALRAFVEELLQQWRTGQDLDGDCRVAITEVLLTFWRYPSRAEAAAWGAFPYEEGDAVPTHRGLATPYGFADLLASFRAGRPEARDSADWLWGSLALTSPLLRSGIGFASRLRSALSPGARLGCKSSGAPRNATASPSSRRS